MMMIILALALGAAPAGDVRVTRESDPTSVCMVTTALESAASGDAPGSRHVSLADIGSAGIAPASAIQARDSGQPVLDDSENGVVVVATYDQPTPPTDVQQRRAHVVGFRIVPLALGPARSWDRCAWAWRSCAAAAVRSAGVTLASAWRS